MNILRKHWAKIVLLFLVIALSSLLVVFADCYYKHYHPYTPIFGSAE